LGEVFTGHLSLHHLEIGFQAYEIFWAQGSCDANGRGIEGALTNLMA
jgi:hypothetical protein